MNQSQRVFLSVILLIATNGSLHAAEISDLFKRVDPTVVILRTFEKVPYKNPNRKGLATTQGIGSGVLISKSGKVLTAAHVVNLAESIHVEFSNGDKTLGRVVASDPVTDVALIQLSTVPQNAVIAPMGNSDQVSIGEKIIVIGAPYGYGHTLTVGYISARRTPKGMQGMLSGELFQTDAAINQGNSGGPMFNMRGEVIGVVSHIQSKSGGSEGLGFAVTMKTINNIVLNKNGFWNGIQGRLLNKKMARLLNIPNESGLVIERVAPDSPAGQAGLQGGTTSVIIEGQNITLGGDIIVSIDNIELSNQRKLVEIRKLIRKKLAEKGSKSIVLDVYRAGNKRRLIVKLLNQNGSLKDSRLNLPLK